MNPKKQASAHLASALIPCGLILLSLLVTGAVPFGDKSILISDACGQYLDFLSLWRGVLSGEHSIFYTFSKNMGGDMLNLAAYYLLSPFNLLFLFSNTQNLPLFYTLVVVLKLSLCGLTFYHTAGKFWGFRWSGLLFSTAYALTAYNVLYGWNIMWLDGVLVLPLLALGLHQMLKKNRPWLYCLCLFYALATNFYIGYMLCITAVLLFAAELFLCRCPVRNIPAHLGRFSLASCIGGLSAACIWLPTFLSLAGERSQTNTTEFLLARNFSVYGFLPKLLCGAASTKEMAGGTPHVFCGTLVLLLVILFLLNRGICLRTKLAAAGILTAVFLSFYLQPLNIIWHGFSTNNSFNYRYSFIFSFFLIGVAQYLFDRRQLIPVRAVFISAGALLAAFLLGILQRRGFSHMAGSAVSLLTLAAAVFFFGRPAKSRIALILLCGLSFAELGLNCAISWGVLTTYYKMVEPSSYRSFVQETEAAVNHVKETDTGFYRMEKNYHRSINDSSLFSYNGLSHFSSTEPVFTKQFMRKMGFSSEYDFWAWYGDGSTAEVDSLLGVKYLLSRQPLTGRKDYLLLAEQEGIYIYQNTSALPVALLCNEEIAEVSLAEQNPVALHNQIWTGLTSQSADILTAADAAFSLQNLNVMEDGGKTTVYTKTDPSQDAAACWDIPVTESLPLYLYFSAPDFQETELWINGEYNGIYFDMDRWNMINAGTHHPGDLLHIELRPMGDTLTLTDAFFFYEDQAQLADFAASLQINAPTLIRRSDSCLEGSFTTRDSALLLFTIPRNQGWQLQIDGQHVPMETVLDTFMAARVTVGTHSFTLRYLPRGLLPGAGLSACALCAACIWFILQRKKRTK